MTQAGWRRRVHVESGKLGHEGSSTSIDPTHATTIMTGYDRPPSYDTATVTLYLVMISLAYGKFSSSIMSMELWAWLSTLSTQNVDITYDHKGYALVSSLKG